MFDNNTITRQIYPSNKQISILLRYFGISRYYHNHGVSLARDCHRYTGIILNHEQLTRHFNRLKQEPDYDYLSVLPETAIETTLVELSQALASSFTDEQEFPKLKRKKGDQSLTLEDKDFIFVEGEKFKLLAPKGTKPVGTLQVDWGDNLLSIRPKQVTITKEYRGKYHIHYTLDK